MIHMILSSNQFSTSMGPEISLKLEIYVELDSHQLKLGICIINLLSRTKKQKRVQDSMSDNIGPLMLRHPNRNDFTF
jgi:hypothetical protein